MDDPARHHFPDAGRILRSRGYATAGFVANPLYCSYDSGLDRGFTHYEDYVLERLDAAPDGLPHRHGREGIIRAGAGRGRRSVPRACEPRSFGRFFPREQRKDAGAINREFLGWLSQRPEPARPFFAFLNYLDAHSPYVLPRGPCIVSVWSRRAGDDFQVLNDHWDSIDKLRLPPRVSPFTRFYDNCIAHLDEGLGKLFDELAGRGVLDRTLVIVTSDHGEGLGDMASSTTARASTAPSSAYPS